MILPRNAKVATVKFNATIMFIEGFLLMTKMHLS